MFLHRVPDVWPAVQGQKRTERGKKAKSTNNQPGDLHYHRPWQADRFPLQIIEAPQWPPLVPKRCLLNMRAQMEKALGAGVKVKVKVKVEKWIFKCRLFAHCSAGDDLMRCVDLYNQTQCKWFEEMVTTSMVKSYRKLIFPTITIYTCLMTVFKGFKSDIQWVHGPCVCLRVSFRSWRNWRSIALSGFSSIYASTPPCGMKQTCSTRVWVFCVCSCQRHSGHWEKKYSNQTAASTLISESMDGSVSFLTTSCQI